MTAGGVVRLGLIGAGASRWMYGPGLRRLPGASLVAVADPSDEARSAAARVLGAEMLFDDPATMLREAELDAVLIASPPFMHREHVLAVAAARLPMMVEKPMARTTAEARRMVDACREAGVLLMVAFNRRLMPPLRTATEMVRAGELGDVFHVESIWTSWSAAVDCGWRDSVDCLGGVFQDHGAHTIDLAQQWLGQMQTVSARATRIGNRLDRPRGVEDHMAAVFSHENGATSLHVHSRASHRPVSEFYRIYGTHATLELEYTGNWSMSVPDPWDMRLYRNGRPHPELLTARRPDVDAAPDLADASFSYYAELGGFAGAVREGRSDARPNGEDGLGIVRAICAAYVAAAEGRTVPVSEGDRLDAGVYARAVGG